MAERRRFSFLAMISRHFRQLWKVRELLERRTPAQEIGKVAGINPYFLQGIVTQARNYSISELRRVFERIFEIDGALKTGGGKPPVLLEKFLLEVCAHPERQSSRRVLSERGWLKRWYVTYSIRPRHDKKGPPAERSLFVYHW